MVHEVIFIFSTLNIDPVAINCKRINISNQSLAFDSLEMLALPASLSPSHFLTLYVLEFSLLREHRSRFVHLRSRRSTK